jgi:hypothetical protein
MSNLALDSKMQAKDSGAMRFFLRALWIALRLAAVIVVIDRGGTFFYQGF